jgi:hypothetical protein
MIMPSFIPIIASMFGGEPNAIFDGYQMDDYKPRLTPLKRRDNDVHFNTSQKPLTKRARRRLRGKGMST